MNIPRILLVGVSQSSWQDWRFGPPKAAFEPYADMPGGLSGDDGAANLPFPVLPEPVFDPARFDGVVFAIPNDGKVRVDLIAGAVEAGIPSLVMKMRPESGDDMRRLAELPEIGRRRLYVGDQYRYHRGAMAVLSAMREGRIGTPAFTSWRCVLPDPGSSAWMSTYAHLTLEDLAYHHLMILFTGLGSLSTGSDCPAMMSTGPYSGTVYAASFNPGWLAEGTKGYCMMLGRLDNGLVIQYETRWGAAVKTGNFFGEWMVEGNGGSLLTDGDQAFFTDRNGTSETIALPEARYVGWGGIVDHFQEMLMGIGDGKVMPLADYDRYTGVYGFIRAGVKASEKNCSVRF